MSNDAPKTASSPQGDSYPIPLPPEAKPGNIRDRIGLKRPNFCHDLREKISPKTGPSRNLGSPTLKDGAKRSWKESGDRDPETEGAAPVEKRLRSGWIALRPFRPLANPPSVPDPSVSPPKNPTTDQHNAGIPNLPPIGENFKFDITVPVSPMGSSSKNKVKKIAKAGKINKKISDLKKKGDYDNPKFWRPITIAVSLGKHLEKVVAYFLEQGNDMNHSNHAYTKGKSCLTAVLDVQAKLAQARKLKSRWKDQEIIYGVGADDIASAFESVDQRILVYAIQQMFRSCEYIKIDKLIESYLHRNSRVTDHETGELLLVTRTFPYKTIPQGSILSPKLWRIYDLTFSVLYENSLKILKERRANDIAGVPGQINPEDAQAIADVRLEVNQSLICFTGTVAYADDHVTVVAILVRKSVMLSVKRELIFKQIWTMRCLIKDATIDMGCDVEPSKSETIFSTQVLEHATVDSRFKTTFKWLGYWLELK